MDRLCSKKRETMRTKCRWLVVAWCCGGAQAVYICKSANVVDEWSNALLYCRYREPITICRSEYLGNNNCETDDVETKSRTRTLAASNRIVRRAGRGLL
jgi:hypothetical protein